MPEDAEEAFGHGVLLDLVALAPPPSNASGHYTISQKAVDATVEEILRHGRRQQSVQNCSPVDVRLVMQNDIQQ
jgi:hypothetical protein